jgi:protein-S-isoprenylcysteine O-methyltransferase Ste14
MEAIFNWDRMVRVTVCLWFFLLAAVVAGSIFTMIGTTTDGLGLARLFSKSCVFTFLVLIAWITIVRTQPSNRAEGWRPRVAAVLGTNMIFVGIMFLTPRADLPIPLHLLSAALILVGNAFAVYTVLHLGRSFSIMAEARRLVTDGPYQIIRHPLYFAEQLAFVGTGILYASPLMGVMLVVHFTCQIRRMLNEEAVLGKTFPEYADYKVRTARLIPGIW